MKMTAHMSACLIEHTCKVTCSCILRAVIYWPGYVSGNELGPARFFAGDFPRIPRAFCHSCRSFWVQVKAPTGQEYSEEEIQCHVHFALYPSSSREPQLGDKRQRMRDE